MSSNNEDEEESRNGNATMSSDSESAAAAAAAATPRLQLNGRDGVVHVDSLVSAPDPPVVVVVPPSSRAAGSRLIFSRATATATVTATSTSSSTISSNADNDNAATAMNDNNTDEEIDMLMESFMLSYTTWKMHVDLMVKMEEFLNRRQHPSLVLLPEATATSMNNDDNDGVLPPMQELLKLLTQEEEEEAGVASKMMSGTGGGGLKVYVGNKLVSSCTDDAEDVKKLPSTDSRTNATTTSVPSSSSSASTLLSLEELSKTLFQPGMQFRGRISIPGLLGGGGQLQHDDSMEEEEGDDDDTVDDEEEEDEDSIYCLEDMEDMYRDDGPEDEEEMERLRRFNAYAGEEVEEEKEEVVMAGEEEAVVAEEEEGVMAEEVVVDAEEQEGNSNSNGVRLVSHNANQNLEREGVSDDPAAAAAADDDPTADRESVTNSQHGLSGIPYELTVLQCGTDPLGNDYIQAKHSAYDDEQVVHIQMNIIDVEDQQNDGGVCRRLEITYEDGETVCKGHWNPNKFRLEGHVYQRAMTNDGVFHTSDSATHVFTLYPCTFGFPHGRDGKDEIGGVGVKKGELERDLLSKNTRAIVAHRSRVQDALLITLRGYFKLVHSLNLDRPQRSNASYFRSLERGCSWDGLLVGYFLRSEQICAGFRRRACLLDSLSFESIEEQLRCIEQWKEAKMDLCAAHADWDEWTGQVKGLVMFGSAEGVVERWLASQRRIHLNFESLESAYQRASARLPRSELAKYEIPGNMVRAEHLSDTCIICQSPLIDEETRVYELPCGHAFHNACVQQWLHDNSSCPMCRFDLVKNIIN